MLPISATELSNYRLNDINFSSVLKPSDKDLGKKALQGDPKAIFDVGKKYYLQQLNESGYLSDKQCSKEAHKVAMKFFLMAAERGYAPAQLWVGEDRILQAERCQAWKMAIDSRIDRDGIEWIRKAANQNNADAHLILSAREPFGLQQTFDHRRNSTKSELEYLEKIDLSNFDSREKSKIEDKISALRGDLARINSGDGTIDELTAMGEYHWETDKWEAMKFYGKAYEKALNSDASSANRWWGGSIEDIKKKMRKDLHLPFNLFAKHYNNLENLKKLSKHFAVLESTPKSHIDFYNQAAACVEINKLEDDGFWSRKFMKILYLRCDSTEFTASDRSLIRNMLNEHWTRFSWNFQEDLCRIM